MHIIVVQARERKGASDGKWVECRLKSFIGAAKESEGVRGSHVISQCCFGCIATGLSISSSVGGGGAVACGQESSVLVIEAKNKVALASAQTKMIIFASNLNK